MGVYRMRHWDEFFGGPNRPNTERMHVTLNHKGVILLSRKVFEKIGSPEAAVLLYDKRNGTIGLRPAPRETQHAFPFKKIRSEIRAMPFCRHHKIKVDRTIAFPEAQLDPERILLLDLHTSIEVGRL